MTTRNTKNRIKVSSKKGYDKLSDTENEKKLIEELEEKIKSMREDKISKCKAAKEQLVEMLDITSDKYRTATGTAEALRVLRFVMGDSYTAYDVDYANQLAWDMAGVADMMKKKADELDYDKMDQLCDGFYDKEFSVKNEDSDDAIVKLAFEMMRIDLCRNVGGSAEDMVEFIKRTQEEIDATGEELKKLKDKKED